MSNASADLNRESQQIWNTNAEYWDSRMGDGNTFQRELVGPSAERLLDLKPGEVVLDVACGNGVFARRMAELGAKVVATDFSERLIELARARSEGRGDGIEYHVADATNEEQLLSLGRGRFDVAVCNMAMMDMPAIDPLMSALAGLLKPGGRFVFAISHPCFNRSGVKKVVEEQDLEGEIVVEYALKVSRYITPETARGLALFGQPAVQYYFERPLHELFNSAFRAGFVLDGMEEPVFSGERDRNNALSWINFREMPPVLVARMRLPGVRG